MPLIITVHSFRAGAGKTTVALNIAALLARYGKRVGLLDANFTAPDVHRLLKLNDDELPRSLSDYLLGRCDMNKTVKDITPSLFSEGAEIPGSVYLSTVYGKSDGQTRILNEGYNINTFKYGLDDLFDELKLDVVIIDLAAGLDERSLPLVAFAEILILVMLLDKQDFQGTGVVVDIARKFDVPRIWLAVNHVTALYNPDNVRDEAEQAYKAEVVALLPDSPEIFADLDGQLVAVAVPEVGISKGLDRIALKILENQEA